MSTASVTRPPLLSVAAAFTDGIWSQPMQGNGIRGLQ